VIIVGYYISKYKYNIYYIKKFKGKKA